MFSSLSIFNTKSKSATRNDNRCKGSTRGQSEEQSESATRRDKRHRGYTIREIDGPQIERWAERTATEEMGGVREKT